ncbi:hypothetical protein U1E44_06525 [Arenibacter sp. GZD96]|uniref:hypothetical protein n=1 Tax=Aurantibrevibacter litoralis TaxID=3106030 RepID=UPI002AFE814C|nr:hypothetical protein [Arenibacter sp. GZD-96]MEA1785738.1 hypothetical protein [Arenibacter sp. GZD-96]
MNKYFLVVLWLFSFGFAIAQVADDKLKHLGAGVVIGGLGGLAANKLFNGDRYWTWSAAVGGSLAAGIVKESYDESRGGKFSSSDVLYTTLGGIISGLAFELFVNRKQCRRRGRPCSCYASITPAPAKTSIKIGIIPADLSENASRSLVSAMQAQQLRLHHYAMH